MYNPERISNQFARVDCSHCSGGAWPSSARSVSATRGPIECHIAIPLRAGDVSYPGLRDSQKSTGAWGHHVSLRNLQSAKNMFGESHIWWFLFWQHMGNASNHDVFAALSRHFCWEKFLHFFTSGVFADQTEQLSQCRPNKRSSNESNLSLQWTIYLLYCLCFHDLSICLFAVYGSLRRTQRKSLTFWCSWVDFLWVWARL